MQITKYAHACFTLEKDGHVLVVDPGVWSDDFVCPTNVAGVIVTHEHADHLDKDKLQHITDTNPHAIIYAYATVVEQLGDLPSQAVAPGDTVTIGNYSVQFTGGQHAVIDTSIPRIANIGVLVDGHIYYPGDSFAEPNHHERIEHLLLPVSAPWCKISEVFDYLRVIKPAHAYPTHDHIVSDTGKDLIDTLCGQFCDKNGITYERLPAGHAKQLGV